MPSYRATETTAKQPTNGRYETIPGIIIHATIDGCPGTLPGTAV